MDRAETEKRFKEMYGEEFCRFLLVDFGPRPHLCPYCRTETIKILYIGDPNHLIGHQISARWYKWCESCLHGIYCPMGTYVVPEGKPFIRKGDEEALKRSLPAGLQLINPAPKVLTKRQELQKLFDGAGHGSGQKSNIK